MAEKVYAPGEPYKYQLLIKHILEMPLSFAPNQEIVYRDKVRLTYRTPMNGYRLATAGKIGVGPGQGMHLRLRQHAIWVFLPYP